VIVSTIWDRTYKLPNWRFLLGILLAALGAALVLRYKPTDTAAPKPSTAAIEVRFPRITLTGVPRVTWSAVARLMGPARSRPRFPL
jgi:hypothetical protein